MLNIQVGRIGEFIAVACLEEHGLLTVLSPQKGIDIFGFKNNYIYRFQVKTSPVKKRQNYFYHQFGFGIGRMKRPPNINDFDICVLVSLTLRKCYFMPVYEIGNQTSTRKTQKFFEEKDIEINSLNRSIAIINKRKKHGKFRTTTN